MNITQILRLEELAMLMLSFYLFTMADIEWWWFFVLILLPDIGMIGYAVNTKVGAITYNLLHSKSIAVGLLMIGWLQSSTALEIAGIIMFGHASMDRMLGYGLKLPDHFKNTHLGWIGKK